MKHSSGDGVKNTLPGETDDFPDSGMPRQLHTQADDEPPLSRAEADVAGITLTPETVYGDTSLNPNDEDQRDVNRGAEDEP